MVTQQEALARIVDDGKIEEYASDLYRFDRTAEYMDGLDAITDDAITRYRDDGYLAVHAAFTPAETAAALDGLLDLIGGSRPDFAGIMFESWAVDNAHLLSREQKQDYVRKLMSFVEYEARLKALAYHPALLAVVERIVGDTPRMFQDMALMKPPGGGREKPWHQDKAYFQIKPDSPVVGVWVALDAATPENGCMHVIPGSHRDGPAVHFKRRDWQLCDTSVESGRDVMVPLAPGGLLLFDGLIHHGTPTNHTDQRRRAVQFHYCGANAIWTDEDARLAVFGGEGRGVTC